MDHACLSKLYVLLGTKPATVLPLVVPRPDLQHPAPGEVPHQPLPSPPHQPQPLQQPGVLGRVRSLVTRVADGVHGAARRAHGGADLFLAGVYERLDMGEELGSGQ